MASTRYALAFCALLSAAGCASSSTGKATWGWPFAQKKEDGPPSPKQRIGEYRGLAKRAKSMSSAELESQSQQLAAAAGTENDLILRAEMYKALGSMNTINSSTALYSGMQDPEVEIRIACCDAWSRRGGADAARVLGEAIRHDESADVRLAATRALGEIRDQSAVLALAPALEDPSPAMQWRAVRSLEKVTGKYYGEDVNAWRSFVQGGKPRQESIVRRMTRVLY